MDKTIRELGFEKFWSAYPKKVAKKDALRAWSRIRESLYPVIMSALEKHKTSQQWQRGYIPHAATWLNGERWEDELSPAAESPAASASASDRAAEANILISAMRKSRSMPADLAAPIAARFRRMIERTKNTCHAPRNWPEYHLALIGGHIPDEWVRDAYLTTD